MKRNPHNAPRLDQLSGEQRAELARWLTEEGLTYTAAQKRVRDRFGLRVGRTALCDFFQKISRPSVASTGRGARDDVLLELILSVDRRGRVHLQILK